MITSFIFLTLLLLLPGLLLFRKGIFANSLHEINVLSISSLPLASLTILILVIILLEIFRVQISFIIIITMVLLLSTALGCVFPSNQVANKLNATISLSQLVLILLFSIAAVNIIFFSQLQSNDMFMQGLDNTTHLNAINNMVSRQHLSLININVYSTTQLTPTNLNDSYPALYYSIVALCSRVLNISSMAGVNALNGFISGPIVTISWLAFIGFVSKQKQISSSALLISSLGSMAFPWQFLTFGPIFPNLLGFGLAPCLGTYFLILLKNYTKEDLKILLPVFLTFSVVVAAAHPGAIFMLAIILGFYLLKEVYSFSLKIADKKGYNLPKQRQFANKVCGALILLILFLWAIFLLSPLAKNLRSTLWGPIVNSPIDAINYAAVGAYRNLTPQPLIAFSIFLGIYICLKEKKHVWLCLSFLLCIILLAFDTGTNGLVKRFLTAFWYTDPYRVAAIVSICGCPLIYIAIEWLQNKVSNLISSRKILKEPSLSKHILLHSPEMITWIILLAFFLPQGRGINPGLNQIPLEVTATYAQTPNSIISQEDITFMQKAKEVVGDDGVVNMPYDGSGLAATPVAELHTLYKKMNNFPDSEEKPESIVLRTKLNELSSNKNVQSAVNYFKVKWVLLLNYQEQDMQRLKPFGYSPQFYSGITSITDQTPGFTVVLQDGARRLYRIN